MLLHEPGHFLNRQLGMCLKLIQTLVEHFLAGIPSLVFESQQMVLLSACMLAEFASKQTAAGLGPLLLVQDTVTFTFSLKVLECHFHNYPEWL